MPFDSLPEAIEQLRNPTAPDSQTLAIKYLKNETIGHKQRKRDLIRHGGVAALVTLLGATSRARGKRRLSETQCARLPGDKSGSWSDEDELRLQAILLISSLANG